MTEELKSLLEKLSAYTYGILYNDGAFISDKKEMARRDGSDIIVQTPKMMDAHKSGMCHDASIYVDEELTRLGIEHKCVYIASHVEPMLPTHSFIAAREGEGWIIIDVFSCTDCVFGSYSTFEEAVDSRTAQWINDDNGGSADLNVFILSQMPPGDTGFVEYSRQVVDKAEVYEFNLGFSHVSYRNTGIYQALKKSMPLEEWKKLLRDPKVNWLPKPPDYNGSYVSWFTMEGYRMFKENVMPIVEQWLDTKKIKEEYSETLDEKSIAYEDEWQVITKRSLIKVDEAFNSIMSSPAYLLYEKIGSWKITLDEYEKLLKTATYFDENGNVIVEEKLPLIDIPEEAVNWLLGNNHKKINGNFLKSYFEKSRHWRNIKNIDFGDIYFDIFNFNDMKEIDRFNVNCFGIDDEDTLKDARRLFLKNASKSFGFYMNAIDKNMHVICINTNAEDIHQALCHELSHLVQKIGKIRIVSGIDESTLRKKNILKEVFGIDYDEVVEYFSDVEFIPHVDDIVKDIKKLKDEYYKNSSYWEFILKIEDFLKTKTRKDLIENELFLNFSRMKNEEVSSLMMLLFSRISGYKFQKIWNLIKIMLREK